MAKPTRAKPKAPAETASYADSAAQRDDREEDVERVAIIFTHGQGEQTPMKDVIELAEAVWSTDPAVRGCLDAEECGVWSVPVYDGDMSEQRRLVTAALKRPGQRSLQVDFYQFYWADLMTGNRFFHLWSWFQDLMKRGLTETPKALRPIRHLAMFVGLVIAAYGFLFGATALVRIAPADWSGWGGFYARILSVFLIVQFVQLVWPAWRTPAMVTAIGLTVASLLLGFWADGLNAAPLMPDLVAGAVVWHEYLAKSLVGALVLAAVAALPVYKSFLVPVMADSARMFSPTPENIPNRDRVRKRGMELLEAIHHSERRYDRVVMLAHSLGTAVAYNVLSQYWGNVYRLFDHAKLKPQQQKVEDAARELQAAGDPAELRACLEAYRAAVRAYQRALTSPGAALPKDRVEWRTADFASTGHLLRQLLSHVDGRQRDKDAYRSPWRVTDFVTCGSPLTYASLLLAGSDADFLKRLAMREYPTSPPQMGKDGFDYQSAPHHAALFAVTCWTNIFFETDFIIRGDIIGGRVGGPPPRGLGRGIMDVAVRRVAGMPLFAHNEYWRWPKEADRGGEPPEHLAVMRAALQLLGDPTVHDTLLSELAPPRKKEIRR